MDAVTPTPDAADEQNYRKQRPGKTSREPMPERRRRLLSRTLVPLIGLSLVAFVIGALLGREGEAGPAERFAVAWEQQDFEAMHAELSPGAQSAYPVEEFTKLYVDAQSTATATKVETSEVSGADAGDEAFDATVATHAFGSVAGEVTVPLDDEGRVDWEPHLVFPGLEPGEVLKRNTEVGERAPILARDGTALAEGPDAARTSPLGQSALSIAGTVGTPSKKQERELFARGFPPGGVAGTSGLELAFNERLAGQPGGQLVATDDLASQEAGRVLGSSEPTPGEKVTTTIDPDVQEAAVAALGETFGGLAVLDARKGDVLGVAGFAWSQPQAPGSTFKVITATAALDAEVVEVDDEFPVEVSNSLIGREISNAHDAPCGGTLTESFAQSCNTVFAPLGVRAGADAMVETAERFGFNEPPPLADAEALEAIAPPPSSYPRPDGDVALGESAIGQGTVLATPLQMASVAQTIANGGVREPNSIVKDPELSPDAEAVKVTSPETAATMKDLMIEVVRSGTGVAAQVPGIAVAGKTGTAELGPAESTGEPLAPGEDPPQKENAWFTAFAPADKPKLAIATVVFDATGGGGGGAVAAPIAQQVLASVLGN